MEAHNTKRHFICFIRHGERADCVPNSKLLLLPREDTFEEYDTPLSKLGVEQAAETGRFLKKAMVDLNINTSKIVIKCSPFIRTIMTASAIAANICDEPVIEIDSRNAEILAEGFFFANPMPKLEYFKCQSPEDIEKLKEKYKISPNVKIITDKDTYK